MNGVFFVPMLVCSTGVLLSLALPVRSARADHAVPGLGHIKTIDDDDRQPPASPAVAWNEACNSFLVVYDRKRTDVDYNIYGKYVNGNGLDDGPGRFQITVNDLKQQDSAVAYNPGGANFVVVWEDYRNNQWEIWAQLVGCNKDLIGSPIQITEDEAITHYQLNPDVTCGYGQGYGDQSGCWIVWEDFRNGNWDIYAQKLTAGGDLDADGNIQLTASTASQRNPAITHNDENTGCADWGSFMVVWNDTRNAAQDYATDIYAQQLDWATLCGGNLPVITSSGEQNFPDIAYGTMSDRYEVVWEDTRHGNRDIAARMLAPNGGTVGNSFALSSHPSTQGRPAVAYDAEFANEFTTVWHDDRLGNSHIYGQRTTGGGALISTNSAVVTTAAATESSPAIAFGDTSNHYFIVWREVGIKQPAIKGRAAWR